MILYWLQIFIDLNQACQTRVQQNLCDMERSRFEHFHSY
jgi:hypothetical protein